MGGRGFKASRLVEVFQIFAGIAGGFLGLAFKFTRVAFGLLLGTADDLGEYFALISGFVMD